MEDVEVEVDVVDVELEVVTAVVVVVVVVVVVTTVVVVVVEEVVGSARSPRRGKAALSPPGTGKLGAPDVPYIERRIQIKACH